MYQLKLTIYYILFYFAFRLILVFFLLKKKNHLIFISFHKESYPTLHKNGKDMLH